VNVQLDKFDVIGNSVNVYEFLEGVLSTKILEDLLSKFPTQTQYAIEILIENLDHLQGEMKATEARVSQLFGDLKSLELIQTLPEVGVNRDTSPKQCIADWTADELETRLQAICREAEEVP